MKLQKIIDNRTLRKATYDYDLAKKREEQVMYALMAELRGRGYEYIDWEFVDPDEAWLDGKFHSTPDTYLWVDDKQYTLEIKYSNTGDFLNDEVYVKCGAIISMAKNPKKFPNGLALIATNRKYSRIPVSEVVRYPIKAVDEWGGKKAYVIPVDYIDWKPWMVGIED